MKTVEMTWAEAKKKFWKSKEQECPLCETEFDGTNAVELYEGVSVCRDCDEHIEEKFERKFREKYGINEEEE